MNNIWTLFVDWLEPHQVETTKMQEKLEEQALHLPDELVVHIFDMIATNVIKNPTLESKDLGSLLQCAQVCQQWKRIAEGYFSKIFLKIMNGENKPEAMTGAQSLGLLYNWKKQAQRAVFLTTSQPSQGEFLPADCHVPVENPTTFDKIEANAVRVLLNSRCLLAVKMTDDKQKVCHLWNQKIDSPEKRILVSTDKKLIATQHYYSAKDKNNASRLACRFDVRHLRTGQLLGQVKVLCPDKEKIFDDKNVQFDFTKFMYQKEGKLRIRHYDPCLVEKKINEDSTSPH